MTSVRSDGHIHLLRQGIVSEHFIYYFVTKYLDYIVTHFTSKQNKNCSKESTTMTQTVT